MFGGFGPAILWLSGLPPSLDIDEHHVWVVVIVLELMIRPSPSRTLCTETNHDLAQSMHSCNPLDVSKHIRLERVSRQSVMTSPTPADDPPNFNPPSPNPQHPPVS